LMSYVMQLLDWWSVLSKSASLIKSDWPLLMSLRHFEVAGLEEEVVDVPEHLAVFCTQCRSWTISKLLLETAAGWKQSKQLQGPSWSWFGSISSTNHSMFLMIQLESSE
jgi:hypothetical protein